MRRFMFRLALACRLPHPDYLPDDLTSKQLSEAQAFSLLEPYGFEVDNYRIAMIVKAIAGYVAGKNLLVEDIFPSTETQFLDDVEVKPQQSVEEMEAILYTLAGADKGDVDNG